MKYSLITSAALIGLMICQPSAAKAKPDAAARQARIAARAEERQKKEADHQEKIADRQDKRDDKVDKREAHQAKRIDQGIKNGSLTASEQAQLKSQEDTIATMESSYKADGKLTPKEMQSLHTTLDTASRCIWADKHNTDGNQMPTYRLGKSVFAKNSFTSQMSDPNLNPATAKALCKDFRRLTELKRTLAGNLPPAQRTTLQAEYNTLLNTYFDVR